MDKITLVFPSDFSTSNLPLIQKACGSLLTGSFAEVVLDLRGVKRFTPFSACYFAALVDSLPGRTTSVVVRRPQHAGANRQIEYLGVKSYFVGGKNLSSAEVPTVAIRHLTSPDYDVAFKIAVLVQDAFKLSGAHYYLTSICLKELLQNAFEHSDSKQGVYACAYGVRTKRVVRICTLDRGIGVREHLLRNPKNRPLKSDEDAIIAAMQEGVTGLTRRSRGLGLFLVRRLLQDIGGELVIASGDSMVSVTPPSNPTCRKLEVPLEGTVVSIKFHAKEGFRFLLDDYER